MNILEKLSEARKQVKQADLKKRPTDEDLREYKKTAKVGRPRKESF